MARKTPSKKSTGSRQAWRAKNPPQLKDVLDPFAGSLKRQAARAERVSKQALALVKEHTLGTHLALNAQVNETANRLARHVTRLQAVEKRNAELVESTEMLAISMAKMRAETLELQRSKASTHEALQLLAQLLESHTPDITHGSADEMYRILRERLLNAIGSLETSRNPTDDLAAAEAEAEEMRQKGWSALSIFQKAQKS